MKKVVATLAVLFTSSVFAAEAPKQPGPPNLPPKPEAAKKAEAKKEAPKPPAKKEEKK